MQTRCTSQLKQMSLVFENYQSDWDGYLSILYTDGTPAYDYTYWYESLMMNGYMDPLATDKMLAIPTSTKATVLVGLLGCPTAKNASHHNGGTGFGTCYGINGLLWNSFNESNSTAHWRERSLKMNNLVAPEATFFLGETGRYSMDTGADYGTGYYLQYYVNNGQAAMTFRHNQKTNILMADGHTEDRHFNTMSFIGTGSPSRTKLPWKGY